MPGVPWRVEFSKIFKIFLSNFQKCPKSFPKESKRDLIIIWTIFSKNFCPVFDGRSSLRKISKKNQKICKFPKMPKIVTKSIQTCFELVLGQTFRKIFAQFSMEGRVLENFRKKSKIVKFPKMPKIVPKSIQTCFEQVLGQSFRKIFAQFSMECRVFENFQNFFIKFPKMPKIVPKSIQTCFERVLGQIFRKIFLPSVPWKVEFSKIFKKKCFQNSKMPKSVPKSIQTCFRVIFSKKNLCPVFHGGSSFRKFSKFFLSNFQKCPKSFPKESKRDLIVIWDNFFEKFLPSVPWRVEFSEIFKKNVFKIPKMPKSVPKSIQTCFEHVLGKIF